MALLHLYVHVYLLAVHVTKVEPSLRPCTSIVLIAQRAVNTLAFLQLEA